MAEPPMKMGEPSQIPLPVSDALVYSARLFVGVVTPLLAISSVLVGTRLYTRIKSRIGICIDDWAIALAAVFAATDWAVVTASNMAVLPGPPFIHLSDILYTVSPLSVVSAVMSALSVPLIKISVAVMLIRVLQGKAWKRFLYVIIAVQVVMGVFVTIMQATRCIPLNGQWDLSITDKKCWSHEAFRISLSVTSVVTIVTDIILSLIPLTFVLQLKRPLRERIVIMFLMSLGLFASGASVGKTIIIQSFNVSSDASKDQDDGMKIALWSNIEEQVGIISACLPCLKSLFHRGMRRLGLITTVVDTHKSAIFPTYAHGSQGTSIGTHNETVHHKTVNREGRLESDEEELVGLPQGNESMELKSRNV